MRGDETVRGSLGDLAPETFRQHGHDVVDWIAGFLEAPERYPVLARVKPGDIRAALPSAAPDEPEPLDRRFRALKLWMVLRAFGRSGIEARLREHTRLARLFAGWVDGDPDWQRVAPVPFSTVVFRLRPRGWVSDDPRLTGLNEGLLEAVNASGEAFLSHVVLGGRYALRLAIGNIRTEERHVQRAWEILRAEALRLGALPIHVVGGSATS